METCFINSPLGITKIEGDENGIAIISVLSEGDPRAKLELAKQVSEEIPENLKEAVDQLCDYFDGKRTDFTLKLNPKGTDFQQIVWKELSNIPFGKTMSYLDLAKKLGDPKVIRAAASANGKNPLWIVVPCHRVIGTDGSLTGYAGGLWRKKWLLEHENPTNQQSLF
ncbi:methylated-DNA--[protein]-cysteine S-methyltransferase [Flavobacterium sp.]|uniref:methylated-DNA--[protein]-cysteine S-methyltransferase n=1 Tax=Flavobacterium sp. TaxID=239 RepID=UPI00374D243D